MLLSHGLTGFVAIKVVAKQAAPSRHGRQQKTVRGQFMSEFSEPVQMPPVRDEKTISARIRFGTFRFVLRANLRP